MRALNPKRSRPRATDDLRLAIACLPRATRLAMLEGINNKPIIVGAYSTGDGICPMLAAHRAGGRTAFIGFAEAWDRFAQRDRVTRRSRRATERELLVLRTHLQASLLEEDAPLAAAIAEHQSMRQNRKSREQAASGVAGSRGASEPDRTHSDRLRREAIRPRPGDPDRSPELHRTGGWAWTRLFRRYDDYERALRRLEDEAVRLRGGEEPRGRVRVPSGRSG